jgi:hypothetical protein
LIFITQAIRSDESRVCQRVSWNRCCPQSNLDVRVFLAICRDDSRATETNPVQFTKSETIKLPFQKSPSSPRVGALRTGGKIIVYIIQDFEKLSLQTKTCTRVASSTAQKNQLVRRRNRLRIKPRIKDPSHAWMRNLCAQSHLNALPLPKDVMC